jgi:hypothetical protein
MRRACVFVVMFLALTSFGRAGDKSRVGAESGLSPTNKPSLPTSSERAASTHDDTVTRADKNSLVDSPSLKVLDVVRGAHGSPIVTGRAKIAVRVYVYPQVSSRIVARAEREVTAILGEAKVETDWLNCVAYSEEPCTCSRCQASLEALHLVLEILPHATGKDLASHTRALGFARSSPDSQSDSVACVFYDRVAHLACGADPTTSHVLALVMTHEIGHLLLPFAGHADSGIMRGEWTPDELLLARSIFFTFTPEQSKLMRASTFQKLGQERASRVRLLLPPDLGVKSAPGVGESRQRTARALLK